MLYANMEMRSWKSMGYLKDLDRNSSVPFLGTCVTGIRGWDIENLKVQDAPNQPRYLFSTTYERMSFILWGRGSYFCISLNWLVFRLRIGKQVFSSLRVWSLALWVIQCFSTPLHSIVIGSNQERNIRLFYTVGRESS